jgi:tellurite methyltransferase
MIVNRSISFFDTQFQKQVAGGDFAFNPFEKVALPFVRGRVLDLGCGLGNLSIAAARHGAEIVAVDTSATAIERIRKVAEEEKLNITPVLADAGAYEITGQYDTIIAIGLLMFFSHEKALALLSELQAHVAAGGRAIVNTLIEGTTFMGMFEPGHYCLLGRDELRQHFKGWQLLLDTHDSFDAPQNTLKVFSTVVAQKQ